MPSTILPFCLKCHDILIDCSSNEVVSDVWCECSCFCDDVVALHVFMSDLSF